MKTTKNALHLSTCFFLAILFLVHFSCKKNSPPGYPLITKPVVTTSAVSNISQGSAICGGTVISTGSSALTARGVCYSTVKDPLISDRIVTDSLTGTGSFVCTLYGLTPNILYHIRAFATNGSGTSYGADSVFTTSQGALTDGYYIRGACTAFNGLNESAMMKVAKNEVTNTDRYRLLEIYIPVKAGTSGFNIVKVFAQNQFVYGPGPGFGTVTNPAQLEPWIPFQRGPVIVTSAVFMVPADGLYHVVFDYGLNIGIVAPVHWGMIGAAVPSGWPVSTDMPESPFNLTAMSWTINNLQMTSGDWKFRYCNGWKIILDTVLDNGGGKLGVSVNTNLGGAISALEPGGDNFNNSVPGIYSCSLSYNMESGYTGTLTKTGNPVLH
ncbi:MAG: hypothetical protein NTW10_08905 [Bacteroidetes bacterium]|nr:hypothetical protein [Bacteroidota bacterium]